MNIKIIIGRTLIVSAIFASQAGFANDWPRFLGPNGNGIVEPDVELELDWQQNPPQATWTRQVGIGCSSFAIADGKALTLDPKLHGIGYVRYATRYAGALDAVAKGVAGRIQKALKLG